YVKQLPVDHLKLDRSFVQGIGVDPRDERLVEVILQLAQGLGLSVIAEGVETRAQKEWLRAKGCVFVQGFLLGRPRPLRDLDRKPGSTPPPPGVMPVDSDPAPAVSHNSELLAARRSRNSLS
ncbi:MAG TPA: EAL domain-containing protein, partial [Polyangiaceae bacterium]|nr:EAL domain-containing protein [Polyangiaceae bacterium]